ncbi:hypothetical protein HKD37_14G040445 [Glycine soja]
MKLLTVGQRRKFFRLSASSGGSLNLISRGNGHLQPTRTVSMTLSVKNMALARRNGPSFVRPVETPRGRICEKGTGHPEAKHRPHVLSRGGYEYLEQKLMVEKTKKRLEEAAQSGSIEGIIDPPSPIRRHVKWKMARTKKTGQMTSEAAKEIAEKIVSVIGIVHPPWTSGCSNCCPWATRTPWLCPCCWSRCHHKAILRIGSTNLPRPTTADPTNQGPVGGVDHIKSDSTADGILQPDAVPMQSQGLALPPELEVGPSGARFSIKESCVDPSGNDLETGDLEKCGLYIEENPSHVVSLGRLYEGSIAVGVEEVKDAEAPVPIPTDEVTLVGQALNTFLTWLTHLVMWDDTMFGMFNQNFPLYIKHEHLSEISHGVCEWGIPMCMDSSSHSPFRDLGNRNLNRKVTSRVGCRVQNAMSTLEPT